MPHAEVLRDLGLKFLHLRAEDPSLMCQARLERAVDLRL
jgi:hypothetical protein